MSVLDAHVHVWDPQRVPHPWLANVPGLDRAFLPADIDTAGGRIDGWVFVETDADPSWAAFEVDWVAGLEWPGLAGIVAHAEMGGGNLGAQLDALADRPLVVGVRPSVQDGPDERIASAAFARDLRLLGERGLSFDACVRWGQLDVLAEAAEQAPGTRIVLDHLGKPPVADGLDSEAGTRWRRSIERLARLPHVFVKCSGIPGEAGSGPVFDGVAGVFDRVALDAFGAERAMFGSDWPVSGVPGTGVPVDRALDALREAASDAEWAHLAGETAREFYGLPGA
ncbi:amidohydrolase family protein [Microbacterium karelineae]|uniref:amidohydrolase family protein n=1 Tax=Microbacterium karelineae TaxID=2654283 RepID=UPI0018D3F13B|nr:amidohydrolase family protein [Microbacterium karelineae]